MTRGDVGVMAPERWQLLMQTAAREFAVAGYERASLNRIIRACGMSKSSFYHYVQSKRQLFDLVADHFGRQMALGVHVPSAQELRTGDFWQQVWRLLDELTLNLEAEPALADLGRMFYLPGAPADDDSAVGRAVVLVREWIDEMLAAGRDAGAVRVDLPATLQGELTMAVSRAFDEWVLASPDLDLRDPRALTEQLFWILRRLLEPDRSDPR